MLQPQIVSLLVMLFGVQCLVLGGWSSWESWERCSVTCGGGSQSRERSCTNSPTHLGRRRCRGRSSMSQSCNTNHCPVLGGWSSWESWERCSVTCGGGSQSRERSCTNSPTHWGRRRCRGRSSMSQSCNTNHCPVDGGLSPWGAWESCSVTCGGGLQRRVRSCTSPPPQWGGRQCQESPVTYQSCNRGVCPVNGDWNGWNHWSICTKTVSGIQIRFRECSNPKPAYGGEHCNGSRALVRKCNKISRCHEVFPLRFKTERNPSVGTMEIYSDSSWKKLCTSTWNNVEVDLTCMVMGYSNSDDYGRWYKDSGNVSETSINFNCTTTLTECKESFSNKSQYCEVRPEVSVSGASNLIREGDTVTLTCKIIQGRPTPQITWLKNNSSKGHNTSLSFSKITKEDAGLYTCEAKNSGGISAENIYISIQEKPTARIRPNSQSTLATDDELTLTCSVNEATVNISWKKDGDPIKERAVIDTQLDGTKSYLNISKVVKDDSGNYSCEARNRLGDVARSTVIVKVKLPPHLNPELKNLSVPLNSTLETDCFERGDLPVFVNWTKDGKALGNNNTLVIEQITFDDGGFYECAAKNLVGKVNISFWIDVTVSPQILLFPVNQSVIDGDPVNFTCHARGVPTPKLTWTLDGHKLPLGINQRKFERDSFLESFLEMQRATKEMAGTYKCTAENKANRTSYSTTLQVFEKPTAKLSPNPYPVLTQGDKLRLTCSVNEATVNITWKKDGDPVKERAVIDMQLDKKTSDLVIAKVVEEDSGEYSCQAYNRLGNVARSIVMIEVNSVSSFLVWYYIVGSMAAAIVILLMGCFFWKCRRTAAATALPNQGETVEMELLNAEVDEWEIEVNRILLQDVIGRGAFGAVWRALLSSPNGRPGNRTVAAKCFTPTAGEEGRKCLMREIELGKILGKSNQPNIVKFIGCVTRQVHPILIMEHLPCGDLLGYMRKCRGINDRYYLGEGRPQVLNNYDLVLFAKQIAAGMVFLGSRGIIHRDLAARNVLLDNNYVCKVTDFGMAYQNFKYGHGNAKKGCLPIKWTAPEILLGNFAGLSTMSDVWSYGIVLYEIVTLGGIPYEGWSEGNVVARVTHGYKLPKPDHVDNKLYAIMKRCWNFDPDFRPPFENLRRRMDTYLREETYLHLLDMGSYDTTKYSKVEDLGDEDTESSARATRNAAAKRLGKWASDRR